MAMHYELEVWKNSMKLTSKIYQLTNEFPREEKYGLVQQLRRSVTSIPTNLAEGAARNYQKEFIQFAHISMGSLSEVETLMIVSSDIGLITQDNEVFDEIRLLRIKLAGFIRHLKKSNS